MLPHGRGGQFPRDFRRGAAGCIGRVIEAVGGGGVGEPAFEPVEEVGVGGVVGGLAGVVFIAVVDAAVGGDEGVEAQAEVGEVEIGESVLEGRQAVEGAGAAGMDALEKGGVVRRERDVVGCFGFGDGFGGEGWLVVGEGEGGADALELGLVGAGRDFDWFAELLGCGGGVVVEAEPGGEVFIDEIVEPAFVPVEEGGVTDHVGFGVGGVGVDVYDTASGGS